MRSRLLRRPALLGALAVLLLGAVAFVVVMSRSELRRTATNSRVFPTHIDVPPGGDLCQSDQYIPATTGNVVLLVGTKGTERGGPLDVSVRRGPVVVSSGRSRAGYGDEPLDVRVTPLRRTVAGGSLCVRNDGDTTVSFYGDFAAPNQVAATASVPTPKPVVIRLDYFGAKPQTWWQIVGSVAERFGLVKPPFFGTWTFWVALAVLLAASGAAVAVVVRDPEA